MPNRWWRGGGRPPPDPEEILRERPLEDVAPLRRITPLGHGAGHSGRAFLAVAEDGRRFKLRVCLSEAQARQIESHLRRLPHVFPRLHARRGRYLLLEFLEGEGLDDRKDLRPYAHHLGRMCGEIHRMGTPRSWRDRLRTRWEGARVRLNFRRQLRVLRRHGLLDAANGRRVWAAWRTWVRRYGVPISLDLHDAHKANFMLDREGGLRYVDEEGLGYTVRGMGLAKLIDPGTRPNSKKRLREWYRFCQGYAEVADAGYLSPDYTAYVRLLELVRSLEFKLRRKHRLFKVKGEADELRELVGLVKPPHGSSDPSVAPLQGSGAP